mmetsp:Transcript_21717/g.29138  ORF Transcript_21717/g.29138 Transcript_21717/m.29138 type:complete len:156 (+) Transcript_21717:246-713(+)
MFGPKSERDEHKRFQSDHKRHYDYLFKIVLTGDPFTGKSCILNQFVHGEAGEQKPTVGVEFTSKLVELDDGKTINLQLWDTAGSERYRSVTKHYYRGAHGVIIVCDITSLESFQNVNLWLDEVRSCAPRHCVIGLMANKLDIMFDAPEKRQVYRE